MNVSSGLPGIFGNAASASCFSPVCRVSGIACVALLALLPGGCLLGVWAVCINGSAPATQYNYVWQAQP